MNHKGAVRLLVYFEVEMYHGFQCMMETTRGNRMTGVEKQVQSVKTQLRNIQWGPCRRVSEGQLNNGEGKR